MMFGIDSILGVAVFYNTLFVVSLPISIPWFSFETSESEGLKDFEGKMKQKPRDLMWGKERETKKNTCFSISV